MREWLWKALCEVVLHDSYSNLYLKNHLQELPEKEQAAASRIFYGTLQNYAYCKAVWERFAKSRVPGRLQVLLTFSVYQLLFMDSMPDYAIIDDAVRMAKKHSPKQAAFINAVLRKVIKEPFVYPEDEIQALALKTSLPEWLIRMWIKQYGKEAAIQFAKASLDTLPVYAAVNPLKISDEDLKRLQEWEKAADTLYRYPSSSPARDPFYREGKISILDPGSYAIARFGNPAPEEKVLDLCAAPGSKTMIMAETMNNTGKIDAFDLHEHRTKLIEQEAERLGIDIIHPESADSTIKEFDTDYDLVLCDVPCSGYGVLARKPDMKLKLKPEEMDTLIPLQYSLLENGAKAVKEGGRLVYSTCTLNKKENEKQVEKFMKENPEFVLDDEQTLYPDGLHDGFYMARLIRKGSPESEGE